MSSRAPWRAWSCALGAALILASCADGGEGEACESSGDCASGVCFDGRCVTGRDGGPEDGGPDGGPMDARPLDARGEDAAPLDAAPLDVPTLDATRADSPPFDAPGSDARPATDAGVDAGFDAGSDAGFDAGRDAGSDAGFDAGDLTPPIVAITSPAASTRTEGTFTVSGTCQTGGGAGPVELSVAGRFGPSTTPCSAGTFSLALTVAAGARDFTVVARQTDLGGTGMATRAFVYSPCPRKDLGSYAVDFNYTRNDAGDYCRIPNRVGSTTDFAFEVEGYNPGLPDPSIMRIGDYYYVTGTSDDRWVANFEIYRSRDLATWERWGTAFPEASRTDGSILLNTRRFCNMWAPHLYQNPFDATKVWLSFTAVEDRPAGTCALPNAIDWNSIFTVSIERDAFVAGGAYFATGAGRAGEPERYHYRLNNDPEQPRRRDGGPAWNHLIPITGTKQLDGAYEGPIDERNPRYCIGGRGCNVWMALDPYLYYDARTGREWLLYTWMDGWDGYVADPELPSWFGNHIAAHPILSNQIQLDANRASSDHFALAYLRNDHNPVSGTWNGCRSISGNSEFCVAEAPAAFRHGGRYYVTFSRNHWNSAAYGTFYRFASTFEGLAAGWADDTVLERPLTTSTDRVVTDGASFGHGEFFIGPGGLPYFIFHAKRASNWHRTPYFKELRFAESGVITPLSDNTAGGDAGDLRVYLIPRP